VSWHGIARLQNRDLGIGSWFFSENIYNSEKNLKNAFSDGLVCTYFLMWWYVSAHQEFFKVPWSSQ